MSYLFTSESVSEGHPDKVADAISDAILDLVMAKQDPALRCACETLVTTNRVVVAGEYKGTWDASTNSPDITIPTFESGDWYFVDVAGTYDSVSYEVNDQIRYNGASFDKIEDTAVKVSQIEGAALSEYDQYVDPDFVGTSTGSTLNPFKPTDSPSFIKSSAVASGSSGSSGSSYHKYTYL